MGLCNGMSEEKYDGLLRAMGSNHAKLTTQAKPRAELLLLLEMIGTPAPLKSEELLNNFIHERWLRTRFGFGMSFWCRRAFTSITTRPL